MKTMKITLLLFLSFGLSGCWSSPTGADESVKKDGTVVTESKMAAVARTIPDPDGILKAVLDGNVKKVKEMVQKDAILLEKRFGEQKLTLMHIAAIGQTNVLKFLIEQGASVRAKSEDNWTPVTFAGWAKNHEAILYLLANGSLEPIKDCWDLSEEEYRLIRQMALLSTDRLISSKEYTDWAGSKIREETYVPDPRPARLSDRIIAERKSGLRAAQDEIQKALSAKDINKPEDLNKYKLKMIKLPQYLIDFYRDEILKAAKEGNIDAIKSLVSEGTDVNTKDKEKGDQTPLHYAVLGGHAEVAEFLVSKGAYVNAKNKNGDTPLCYAVQHNAIEVVKFLVSHRADVNVKYDYTETLLHHAVEKGYIEVAKILVSKGADVNAKGNYGFTPLHRAQDVEIAKILVSKGADVNAKSDHGSTPLYRAQDVEIAKFLVSKGADVNAKDNSGSTPLHYAANKRDVEVVKFLVSKGADANAKSSYGSTPLHEAWYDVEIAKFLVSQGADVNAKEDDGDTPLHNVRNEGVAKFLISQGANVRMKNKDGDTPLDVAKRRAVSSSGYKEIAEYLSGLK